MHLSHHPDEVAAAAAWIQAQTAIKPTLGVILGSGLGAFAQSLERAHRIPYRDIPHFPVAHVPGHASELVVGELDGVALAVMSGRVHYYEGHEPAHVTLPVRVLGALGVSRLVVTNASGGLNPAFAPGTLMVIEDHINLTGINPLRGPHAEGDGPRFVDMTEAYSSQGRAAWAAAAEASGITLERGIYLGVSGPSYETPAEVRMMQRLGGDAVGMSTVSEVLAARQIGMEVAGLSVVTNPGAGLSPAPLNHAEVTQVAQRMRTQVCDLLRGMVQHWR
jgi:purine-nucleoside phosphorylase